MITSFLDLLVPPRRAERVVSTLTREDLDGLALRSLGEAGLPYREPLVRDLVWEIKYYGNGHAAKLAGEYLADELLALAAEELGAPLLVPVPMHDSRRKERGHNQTEILCEAALEALTKNRGENSLGAAEDFFDTVFEYAPTVLKRIIDTPHQQGLHRRMRLKNVENSMRAVQVTDRVCVVVDDVATTGATLSEAKRALMAAGARRVHCVALARS